jgi:quinol monooxygenase YgiN
MAGFVQIIEFQTSKPDEVRALGEEFRKNREAGGDGASPVRLMACADRDNPGHYFNIVEFASYEEAMANSESADTQEFAARMMELCDGPTTFRNLDLRETAEMS